MIILPIGAIRSLETKKIMDSSLSGKLVKEYLPPTTSLPCFGLEILSGAI